MTSAETLRALRRRVIESSPDYRAGRDEGYREGRASVWAELQAYAAENRALAERILGHPIVTADEVRGVLSSDSEPDPL